MTRGAGKEGLSRRHRFAGRGSFAPALRSPRKFRSSIAVLHVVEGHSGISRFGLALARRVAPRSVDRNRFRRLAREIFRRHPVKGRGLDLVLTVNRPLEPGAESDWVAEVSRLLARACDRP